MIIVSIKEILIHSHQLNSFSKKDLVNIFNTNKNITLELNNKDTISVTCVCGSVVKVDCKEIVLLRYLRYNKPHYSDPGDEGTYTIIDDHLVSPLDTEEVIDLFLDYCKSVTRGIQPQLVSLTPAELERIKELQNNNI